LGVRRDLTNDEMLALFKDEPFDFNPGENYRYDNSGYFLLGVIVEKVSGLPFPRYLDERLFKPLGLRSTMYCAARPIVPHRAAGYIVEGGMLLNALPISTNVLGGAGSLCSTVLDLVAWQRAFNAGRVVSAASRDRIRAPGKLNSGEQTSYGFGLGIGELEGHRLFAHGGGVFGFATWLGYYPDDDLTVTVLSNQEDASPKQVGRLISRLVLGMPLPTVADLPVEPGLRSQIVGKYDLNGEAIAITEKDGALWIGRDGAPVRLLYQGNGLFRSRDDVETAFRIETANGVIGLTVLTSGKPAWAKKV
ncbi:MAG: serine hydrolase domain-containing protein, partial [Gemmatimonadota bacterium]